MTKAELIAEITAFYTIVGVPFETSSSDEHVPEQINTYSIIVYETGLSEANKRPVLKNKYINFIVYEEYLPGEAAYYSYEEPTNDVNTDVTSDNSLSSIHKLYTSDVIRGKVQAAIAISAQDVLNESMPFELLASNASSGQKSIIVTNPNIFWVGKTIRIYDSLNSEENTIAGIDGSTLTMANDLANNYTTANDATAEYVNDVERQQWATNALLCPDNFTLCMTSLVSLDATVQASGGLATDTQIRTVVNAFINKVASSSYL